MGIGQISPMDMASNRAPTAALMIVIAMTFLFTFLTTVSINVIFNRLTNLLYSGRRERF